MRLLSVMCLISGEHMEVFKRKTTNKEVTTIELECSRCGQKFWYSHLSSPTDCVNCGAQVLDGSLSVLGPPSFCCGGCAEEWMDAVDRKEGRLV